MFPRMTGRPSEAVMVRKFWERVQKTETCWIWTGNKDARGYGRLDWGKGKKRRVIGAHRWAWEALMGPIPTGAHVLHDCDNPSCVRPGPGHLHLGDHVQNMREMRDRGRCNTPAPRRKLSNADIAAITKSKEPHRVIAARYGVCRLTIWRVRRLAKS